MSELWCVNVIGPDDVIPAASLADALRAAHAFNEWSLEKQPPEDEAKYVLLWANVTQWPYGADVHAELLTGNGGSALAQCQRQSVSPQAAAPGDK